MFYLLTLQCIGHKTDIVSMPFSLFKCTLLARTMKNHPKLEKKDLNYRFQVIFDQKYISFANVLALGRRKCYSSIHWVRLHPFGFRVDVKSFVSMLKGAKKGQKLPLFWGFWLYNALNILLHLFTHMVMNIGS